MERLVWCRHLTKAYGSRIVLRDVSFRVERGQWVMLTGEDGAGKTTLLHILMGFLTSYQGRVEVLGMRANRWRTQQRGQVRFVPQGFCAEPGFAGVRDGNLEKNKLAQLAEALGDVPELLILDEPFSLLTPEQQERAGAWLRSFHRGGGTILMAQESCRSWEGYYSNEIHLEKGMAE